MVIRWVAAAMLTGRVAVAPEAGNGRPTQLGGAFAEIRDYPTPVCDIETLNLP